jgi:ribosomal protein L21E
MKKSIREKGKIRLSRMFQKLEKGARVAVVKELAVEGSFPKRMQGKTGIVEEKRGDAYLVKIQDGKKEKKFIIKPVHLKKLK